MKAGVISTKPRGARKPNRNTMNGTEGKIQEVLDNLHSKTLNGAEGKNLKTEELETSLEQIQERMGDYVAKSDNK